MNKIKVVDDILDCAKISKDIYIEYYRKECIFGINEVKIIVTKDTDLYIDIKLKEETKLNFSINVKKDVNLNLNIITEGESGKVQYKYILEEKASVNVNKIQNVKKIKEMIIVKLLGEKARIDYKFKTVCNKKETYDYHIFHDAKNTISNIKNNGVCIKDGVIVYQVSSFVPKDIKGCIVNQSNRIVNLTENKSEIMPNLYIDCNDVEASHSALIGKFSDEEIFYLMSRGITYEESLKLLITGFLTSEINDKIILKEINKNIDKYWR